MGGYVPIELSSASLCCSTSCITVGAVNCFVIEPIRYADCAVASTLLSVPALPKRIQARGVLDSVPAHAFGPRVFRLRDPDEFRLVISLLRSDSR